MLFKSVIALAALSAGVSAAPQYSGSSSSGYSGSSGSGYSGSSGSGYSGSSNSGYSGSSNSGYSGSSGCSSGDCGSSDTESAMATSVMMDSSSTMMMDSTSTMMMDSSTMMMDSSTMMMDSSTMMVESTSTMMTESALATSTMYGSGSSSWSDSGYDGCVQQCIASFGSSYTYTPPPPSATSVGSDSGSGNGVTHTVIVAPTQGVLRYVPFAVNASVGDTVLFQWGANNHTVTKSSELTPCNKTSDAPFATGEQNMPFSFTQVVNDTSPTFFYCGTPGHCEAGMFGIINPPSVFNAPTSVSGMMSSVIANDSTGDISTYASYTNNQTSGSMAANWGANIDMSSMPSWAQSAVVENVLFTRNVLAMNPDVMNADGSVAISSNPLMFPPDVGSALAAASSSTSSSGSSPASGSSSSSASAASSSPTSGKTNGAISVTSHKALVGAMVLVATYFAL